MMLLNYRYWYGPTVIGASLIGSPAIKRYGGSFPLHLHILLLAEPVKIGYCDFTCNHMKTPMIRMYWQTFLSPYFYFSFIVNPFALKLFFVR